MVLVWMLLLRQENRGYVCVDAPHWCEWDLKELFSAECVVDFIAKINS